VKTEGRIEGFVHKIERGTVVDERTYRPSMGRQILRIADTAPREGLEPHLCIFAVMDPDKAIAQVKAHRDANR
jgi:hypothetical protein